MQKSGDKKTNTMEKEIYLVQSALSAKQTVARVRCILREKSIPISLIIDHAQEAAACGVKLRPTYTILAGSPAMRAQLLLLQQALSVLLPLRINIWEDADGKVWLAYLRVESVMKRYGVKKTVPLVYLEHIMENISHRACQPAPRKK